MFVQIENILRFLTKTQLCLLSKIHFLPSAFHAWKVVYFFQSFCKYFSRDISCPIPCSPARMPSQRAHFSLSEVPGHREWGPSAVHREVALASSSTGGRGPGQQHRRPAGAVCFTSLIAPVFPFSWGSKGGIWRPGTKGRPRLSSFSSVDSTRRLSPCFTSST